MQLPRITKSIFLDQFIFMQSVGVLIGFIFPVFLVWYGFSETVVLTLNFYLVSLAAGQVVGLISFLLVSTVIRPHLKLLSNKMQEIAEGIQMKTFSKDSDECSQEMCHINVTSNDEIGVSAVAYNQLLDSLMKAHEVEKVFNEFTVVMSENLDLANLADESISLLLRSTNFEAGAVLIVQEGSLELIASQGILDAETLVDHDAVTKVLQDAGPVRINLPRNIDLDGVLTSFKPSEVFIEPIEFKGMTLGVFVTTTGAHLADTRTEQLVKLFSRSIGLAVNNAMIHSKFQRLAAVDSLTSIYNRRFGMERLKEDFTRSVRNQSNMSVAMVDIDHFKSVNDNYGHLVGDRAIKIIAKIIKNILRGGDIVIRYGGEEFLMVLHGATTENARNICERIRHQVMDTVINENNQQLNLTVSIGLVSYPEHQVTDEMALIHKADQALYFAKEHGRNKVSIFGKMED